MHSSMQLHATALHYCDTHKKKKKKAWRNMPQFHLISLHALCTHNSHVYFLDLVFSEPTNITHNNPRMITLHAQPFDETF